MKSIYRIVCGAAAIALMAGCSDDDKVFVYNLQQPNVSAVDNINANIAAVKKAVAAKKEGLTVSNVTRLADANGAMVEFSDGTTVAYRTVVGAMGDTRSSEMAASTPMMAVKADDNGDYYWTLDGEWLTVDGNFVSVTDETVGTPELYVSEGGSTWNLKVGDAVVEAGPYCPGVQKSAIASVDASDKNNIVLSFASQDETLEFEAAVNVPGGGDEPLKGSLRRPISTESPAWLIHIDCWNYPDPDKIIDLIPADILPYTIFNLSLSVSHDEETGRFRVSEYGYELVKTWLRTCAERNVWAMIQPASGGWCHFPDVTSYEQFDQEEYGMFKEFFEGYPNFLGFNYCEQFWGFDGNDPGRKSVSWNTRVGHWNELLKLTHEYGGYLCVSFCANYWSAPINPVAMIKKHPNFAETTAKYPENFIMCEKYTQSGCFFDVEAECMGVWLSGHADNYGIRFDQCAWNEWASEYYYGKKDADFPVALGAALQLEHITLTGQTVIDGPELIWQQDFTEVNAVSAGDGYSVRAWKTFPQFRNINIDLFRKILDGTIRIMSKREVIDRAKMVIIQDVQSGQEIEKYCLPKWFHLGTSALDHDNGREDNHFYLRKTGRYPAVPVVAELAGADANSFEYKYNQSTITKWQDQTQKIRDFNRIYPQEYEGDIFAGRQENCWVTYNPYKQVKSGKIPFQYNTCESMELDLETFTTGVWREYANKLTCYLTNYNTSGTKVTSVIRINGAKARPSFDIKSRAECSIGDVDEKWENGVYTITLKHNGPMDLTLNCSGNATDRKTDFTTASLTTPQNPALYHGARQYETEYMEYKSVGKRVNSGYSEPIRNYTGQGYVIFGKSASAALRDHVSVLEEGMYSLKIKYRSESADVKTADIYVNGQKVGTPEFIMSGSDNTVWYVASIPVNLKEGKNTVELKASSAAPCDLYLDNFIIDTLN